MDFNNQKNLYKHSLSMEKSRSTSPTSGRGESRTPTPAWATARTSSVPSSRQRSTRWPTSLPPRTTRATATSTWAATTLRPIPTSTSPTTPMYKMPKKSPGSSSDLPLQRGADWRPLHRLGLQLSRSN
eukprot:13804077-Alexandrium_andersonii.AAC.1